MRTARQAISTKIRPNAGDRHRAGTNVIDGAPNAP